MIQSDRLFALLRKMLSLYSSKTAIAGVRVSGVGSAFSVAITGGRIGRGTCADTAAGTKPSATAAYALSRRRHDAPDLYHYITRRSNRGVPSGSLLPGDTACSARAHSGMLV